MARPTACCSTTRTPITWPPSMKPTALSNRPSPKTRPMLELAPLLVSAVILGLLGGGHCLGMCGGLMGALTLAIPKEQRSRRFRLLLAYNLGRILSYATAGLLIGLAGWAVASSPAAMFSGEISLFISDIHDHCLGRSQPSIPRLPASA